MNAKQVERVRKLVAALDIHGFSIHTYEDAQTRKTVAYGISIDDRRYDGIEEFYRHYPECHSPYKVVRTGDMWSLVFVEDEDTGRVRPVDGEPVFTHRQAAYRRRKELNDWWQARQLAAYR